MQSQKVVSAYLQSKHILPFDYFARQYRNIVYTLFIVTVILSH